jgi:hypothetical protein
MRESDDQESAMNEDKPSAKGERRDVDKPDPLTEQIGSHSLAAAGGAVGGAAAGAVSGIVFGPVGSLAGAIAGAVLGGAAGASTGGVSDFDIAPHEDWWREHYAERPYVRRGAAYDDYAAAYRFGTLAYARTDRPREWDEVEPELATEWESMRGESLMPWDEARDAVRDAWNRMYDPQRY